MRILSVLIGGLFTTSAALAGPWLDPGDSSLRHDIQVLSDAGVIAAPVSTWPLSWGDIQDALNTSAGDLRPAELAAVARLQQRLSDATITDRIILRSYASVAENPRQIRNFEDDTHQ